MCVDYRKLNQRTRKDSFPLPQIDESLDALNGAQWFTTLDLASGFNQVAVEEKNQPRLQLRLAFLNIIKCRLGSVWCASNISATDAKLSSRSNLPIVVSLP